MNENGTQEKKIVGEIAILELLRSPRWEIMYKILENLNEIKTQQKIVAVDNATREDYETLEKFGLIHYFINPDGTYRYLYITRKGIIFLKKYKEMAKQMEKRFFDPVVEVEALETSMTARAVIEATALLFNMLETEIDTRKNVVTFNDIAFMGSKNEKEIKVSIINKDKPFCITCGSEECEHAEYVKLLMEHLDEVTRLAENYKKVKKAMETQNSQ